MEILPKSLSSYNLNQWLIGEYEKPIIIDVRESSELEIAYFPNTSIHIPMSSVSYESVKSQLKNLNDKKFVILCHRGIRSFRFGKWLLDNDLAIDVWNLDDGIDGWSQNVDDRVPRY